MSKLLLKSTIGIDRRRFLSRSLMAVFTTVVALVSGTTVAEAIPCCTGAICGPSQCSGSTCSGSGGIHCTTDYSSHLTSGCWWSPQCSYYCCDCTCCDISYCWQCTCP